MPWWDDITMTEEEKNKLKNLSYSVDSLDVKLHDYDVDNFVNNHGEMLISQFQRVVRDVFKELGDVTRDLAEVLRDIRNKIDE